MNINERDRGNTADRGGARRAPWSGGRTTEQRETHDRRRTPAPSGSPVSASSVGGARGARHHTTVGTAALKLDVTEPARAIETPAPPRLRVAPPRPVSAPRAPFVAVVIALVLAGVFGILVINTKTNENTFQLSRLQSQQSVLDNQQQELDREIAERTNPGNLDAAARILGLVKSDQLTYITLPNGDVIGMAKPNNGPTAITAAQNAGADSDAGR